MTSPVRTTSCPDWERRIVAGETLLPFPPLFPAEAEWCMEVFESLRLADIIGCPTIGQVSRPWLLDFAAQVFGSLDDSGVRHITEYFLLISKKNSKSTLAAGVMLTMLICNRRDSAEFLVLSPTKEVADNSFKPIRDMIAKDPDLTELFQVQSHIRTITHRTTKATLQVVAADSATVAGKKATGVFVDELHEFGKMPKASDMLLEATGGLTSRPEGFVIYATTQSSEPPAGVFREKLQYARGVRDGTIHDPKFLPLIYEYPKHMLDDKSARLPENLYVTNPNLGASVSVERLLHLRQQAQEAGEEKMLEYLSKHQNIEIGLALRSDRWAGADFWEALGNPAVTLDAILDECEVVDVGIDGGGLDDLLGLSVVGRNRITRRWMSWAHAWAHESVLERRKQEAARLRDFERDGDLTIVAQMGDDVAEVAAIVERIKAAGVLDKVGCDPYGIGAILDALHVAGVDEDEVIGISQGWKLSGAILTTERKLAEGGMVHAGAPLMAWCVGNARVEPKGNAVLITKQASGSGKIDPLMALFNAVSLMSLNPAPKESVYNTRGVFVI